MRRRFFMPHVLLHEQEGVREARHMHCHSPSRLPTVIANTFPIPQTQTPTLKGWVLPFNKDYCRLSNAQQDV
ncbi:hypothetical protein [Carnimonas nigrificans]|uniref:hypothetical protein n=1 Tax=Carnimonas nigrificans TaxID=64323 RepID=UPI0012EB69F7|nr:hypothetical protein [Carnimonas nigrificans]